MVVLDEGYVQFLSSLAFNKKIERGLDEICRAMNSRFYTAGRYRVAVIRCSTKETTNIERLLNRSRKNDRNIHENEQVMRFFIRRRCDNIDQIIDQIKPAITFSCLTDDGVEAASAIIQIISPMWTEATKHAEKGE